MKTLRTFVLCLLIIGFLIPAVAKLTAQETNQNKTKNSIQNMTSPIQREAITDFFNRTKDQPFIKARTVDWKNFLSQQNNNSKVNKDNSKDRILSANPIGVLLGSCWFDQQCVASMPHRITTFSYDASSPFFNVSIIGSASGSAGKADFLSFGGTQPQYTSMGTYYQFLDFSGDQPLPQVNWKRVEKFPSYTGSLFIFNDGSEGVISHVYPLQFKSLEFCYNDQPGVETFKTDSIRNTMNFFPRSAADGANNVHTLYNHRIIGEQEFNQLGYKKGFYTYANTNWSNEILFTGQNALGGAMPELAASESYAIDASGNTVLIAWVDRDLHLIYRFSQDNGTTWSRPRALFYPMYDSAYPEYPNLHIKNYADGTHDGWTDSLVMSPGPLIDCIIDNNGNFNIVSNLLLTCHVGNVQKNSNNQWEFIQGSDSVIWGKQFYTRIGFVYIYVPSDTNQKRVLSVCGPPNGSEFNPPKGDQTSLPYNLYWNAIGQTDTTRMADYPWLNDSLPSVAAVADPQLGYDPDGNIYLVYNTIRDSINTSKKADFKTLINQGNSFDIYNRHIFAQMYDNVAQTWSNPTGDALTEAVNLTPNGVDCAYGSLAKVLLKKKGKVRLPIVYEADIDPLDWIVWNPIFTMNAEPQVYMYPFDPTIDGSGGTLVSEDNMIKTALNIQPNPVSSNAYIYYNNVKSGYMQVELFNMLGQKVETIFNGWGDAGVQSFTLDAANLVNGNYICRVTSNGASADGALIISK